MGITQINTAAECSKCFKGEYTLLHNEKWKGYSSVHQEHKFRLWRGCPGRLSKELTFTLTQRLNRSQAGKDWEGKHSSRGHSLGEKSQDTHSKQGHTQKPTKPLRLVWLTTQPWLTESRLSSKPHWRVEASAWIRWWPNQEELRSQPHYDFHRPQALGFHGLFLPFKIYTYIKNYILWRVGIRMNISEAGLYSLFTSDFKEIKTFLWASKSTVGPRHYATVPNKWIGPG